MSFDFSPIGMIIKDLRTSIGMSQSELCRDICSQSQLSKIESGEAMPLAATLYLLSTRLGVTVNYIFDMSADGQLDYVLDVKEQIRGLIRKKEYEAVYAIVLREEGNPNFTKNALNRQFLLWHKGVCTYYIEHDGVSAIACLKDALEITKSSNRFFSEQEMAIYNSLGGIQFAIGNLQDSLRIFERVVKKIKRAPSHSYSLRLKVRVLYNYAKVKTRNRDHLDAIDLCKAGIRISLENESLYLLGELNYYAAYNYFLSGNAQNGQPFLVQADAFFKTMNLNHTAKIQQLRSMMDDQPQGDLIISS